MRSVGCRGPDRRIIPGSVSGSVSGCRSDHIRSILQSPPNTGGRLRSGGALTGCVPGVSRSDHIRSIRSGPHRPEGCESCTGRAAAPFPLGAETSRAGRLEGVRVFSGTAGTCRVRVRNPGALRGRLGAGVVAYVPLIRAYVTLSQVPREGALFPPHCSRRITPGRYASAAYPPAGGGTTGNMARIPGGRVPGMLRYVAGRPRRSSSVRCFGMVRYGSVRRGPGVRRFASPSLVGGGTGPDMARILPGSRSENTGPSRYVALCRAACQGDPGGVGHFSRVSGCTRPCGGLIGAGSGSVRAPGVPVPVTVCVLVQVAHYGAVAVPRALSHCPAVKYGVSL